MASTIPVNVKWDKQKFEGVELDPSDTVEAFRAQLFALTGVPPENQKIMGFKGGVLKDDADFSAMKLKPNMKVMLVGTATSLPEPPKEKVVFIEDMTEAETAALEDTAPPGLNNLGNTCYMNSTIQCLGAAREFRDALVTRPDANAGAMGPAGPLISAALRDLYSSLDQTTNAVMPVQFIYAFRQVFPQFAERNDKGQFAQQDAQEAWNQLMSAVLPTISAEVRTALFGGTQVETLTCEENPDEPPVVQRSTYYQLSCNITNETNFLMNGLVATMVGQVEKNSESLGRSALYKKTMQLDSLPAYLTVQFVRFYWRQDKGVKAKILRDVKFTMFLDVFDLCSEELQEQLRPGRARIVERTEEIAAWEMSRSGKGKANNDSDEDDDEAFGGSGKKKKKKDEDEEAIEAVTADTTDTPMPDADAPEPEPLLREYTPFDVSAVPEGGYNNTGHYELCAVLTHQGRSADSGHYVGWVRRRGKEWLKFDDDKVSECSEDDILKLSGGGDHHIAYILLYRTVQYNV